MNTLSDQQMREVELVRDVPSLALQIKEKGLRKPGKPRFIFI